MSMKTHYYNDEILSICDGNHCSVDTVFEEIRKKFPDAGKSSIYRNMEMLVEKWELQKLSGIGKKAFFEKSRSSHVHLVDEKTWDIMDLDLDLTKMSIPNLPKNFDVTKMEIKVFGEFR